MESLFALFAVFLLVLFGSTTDARPDGGEYWKGAMKDQPMPEALQALLHRPSVSPLSTTKTGCHTSTEASSNDEEKDFEPRPRASGYNNDGIKLAEEKSFASDFERMPNLSVYHDDGGKKFVEDFEPRPNVSVYHDDAGLKGENTFVKDFKPRPSITQYQD